MKKTVRKSIVSSGRFLLLMLLAAVALSSSAVTREEMEKARAISAKIYLRWANNGSDYLEKLNPSTLSELEGSSLKEKEKENIKAFRNIPVPSDYESWDKARLVEYWSGKALQQPGLNPDGVRAGAKGKIKSELNKMNVTAPRKEAPAEEPKEAAPARDTLPEQAVNIPDELTSVTEVMEEEAVAEADSIAALDSVAAAPAPKKSSSTWIYIVALALLVIAVIALVVYASKNMGNNVSPKDRAPQRDSSRREKEPVKRERIVREESREADYTVEPVATSSAAVSTAAYAPSVDSGSRRVAELEKSLAVRDEEVRALTRQVDSLTRENLELREKNEALREEVERARRTLTASAGSGPAESRPRSREIYLGRVNSRGLFIRADRNFNPGNSIYALVTRDGFTGTFHVVDNESVADLVLPRPVEMLGGGCLAADIEDTVGYNRIVTESPGTAIFENNCWRVTRKARIRYE